MKVWICKCGCKTSELAKGIGCPKCGSKEIKQYAVLSVYELQRVQNVLRILEAYEDSNNDSCSADRAVNLHNAANSVCVSIDKAEQAEDKQLVIEIV